ncbi:MAG: hypothetical protein PHE70_11400 [Tepidanaerobacteraceae bacterium]|nr:hypothetical protein [Tepidanaerobacteraceae bacterium]
MKTLSISNNDLQLLKAIRPFMSGKSQELLDLMLTTIDIFRPEQPDQKVNFDALNTLLTMVHESVQSKKYNQVIEVDEYEPVPEQQSNNIENLLNILAEKESKDD